MTVPQDFGSPMKDDGYHPPNWNGHRTYLSIAATERGIGTFSISDGNELAPPRGVFHAWLMPLLWCGVFFTACESLLGPYLPLLAREKHLLELSETSIIFAINRGATAVGALLAYCVINASNGGAMLKSGAALAGASFAAYGGLYYLKESHVTEYMGVASALYGMGGFCRAFFLVFTLTTLFYHYAKKFRLYICMFEFLNGMGAAACLIGSYYLHEQMRPLPFFVIGGCLIFGSIFACTISPDRAVPSKRSTVTSRNGCRLLCDISLLLDVLTIAVAWISISYFDNYLYVKIAKMEGKPDVLRTVAMFIVFYCAYGIGTVIFGTIGLIWRTEAFSALLAQALAVAGFIAGTPIHKEINRHLGRRDGNLQTEEMTVVISMALVGLAAGGQTIPMMKKLVRDTMNRGFARTIWTMSTLSTTIVLCSAILACGTCLMTGFVEHYYGSLVLSYAMLGINAVWFVVRLATFIVDCFCRTSRDEAFTDFSTTGDQDEH